MLAESLAGFSRQPDFIHEFKNTSVPGLNSLGRFLLMDKKN